MLILISNYKVIFSSEFRNEFEFHKYYYWLYNIDACANVLQINIILIFKRTQWCFPIR